MVSEAFLKVKEGHFVTVKRNSRAGLELCVVELKEEATSVKILERERGGKRQIAFSFPSTDGHYSPKVNKKKLQLEKIADVSEIHEPYHWFEKVDLHINEHYGLRSVGNPVKTVRHALSSQMKHEETNHTFDNKTADFPAGVNRQRVPGQSVAKSPEAEVCVRLFLESLPKKLSFAKENLRRHSAAEQTQHFGHILSEDFSFLSPEDHLTV
ncbi:hypothetical protein JOQ06_030144 [Pogonophryne albipinna]|uniref:Uncharacterized protein n=1 Tax=Pogonophryne albipinna TaxID=1090488 RepID=A0AAD6FH06_9TELE|nr:hypothetical protein JOQ06_030144 [Pogonophryne albipinna]